MSVQDTSTETVTAMQYVPLDAEVENGINLPSVTRNTYMHYRQFWVRWQMGTPTVICLSAMWLITVEVCFTSAGFHVMDTEQDREF